jgi:hypothetical protein
MSNQTGWRWCQKCQGSFFSGNPDQGNCPSGGTHDGSASGKYLMQFGEGAENTQPQGGWRWCEKCQGMFFSLLAFFPGDDFSRIMCPAGGHHAGAFTAPSHSGHYVMEFGEGGSDAQGGWRFCKKCFGLFFSGNPDQGNCPSGGKHDNSKSGPYMLHFERDLPESVILHSGSITSGLSIGGFANLFMGRGGDFTFSGHMHDSGALGIDFLLTLVALTPSGIAFTTQHSGHTAGTFTPGSRDDDWTVPGFNERIRDNWPEASQATLTWALHANDTLTPQLGKALEEALQQALLAAGKAAVTALIALV